MERNKERIRVVVDSNIIFSLIIKEKSSAYLNIFLKDNFETYAPEDIIREFRIHREELEDKSEEFERGIFLAFSFIRVIPREFYNDIMEKAYNICKKFDQKDSPFVGLALKLEAPIWTNDKGILQNEGEYQTITTAALKELLEKKGEKVHEYSKIFVEKRYEEEAPYFDVAWEIFKDIRQREDNSKGPIMR